MNHKTALFRENVSFMIGVVCEIPPPLLPSLERWTNGWKMPKENEPER
jgi:hypothetical protein